MLSKYDISDIFLDNEKYIECPTCQGTGIVKRYPYYSMVMPQKIQMSCNTCNGLGRIKKIIERLEHEK